MNRRPMVGLAIVGAFAVGGLVGHESAADGGRAVADSSSVSPGATSPPPGPVEAALAAVAAQTRLYRRSDLAAVERDIRERTTTGGGAQLAVEFRKGAERLAKAWPEGPTGWWVAPLATRTTDLAPDQVRVEVWFAEVVVPPRLDPYADWRTTTFELHREKGMWKVAESKDGPAPFLRTNPDRVPASRPAVAGFLTGFEGTDGG